MCVQGSVSFWGYSMKRDVLFGVSASSNGVASNRKVLGSGTALAALAVAMYFSPLSVNSARADCVDNGGSPE